MLNIIKQIGEEGYRQDQTVQALRRWRSVEKWRCSWSIYVKDGAVLTCNFFSLVNQRQGYKGRG